MLTEHAPLALLARPEQRLRLAVLDCRSPSTSIARRVADEVPVALVHQLELVEVPARSGASPGEVEVERAVAELRLPALPRQADALGQRRRRPRGRRPRSGCRPAPPPRARKASRSSAVRRVPAGIVRVEDDHVGRLELLRRRPALGGLDASTLVGQSRAAPTSAFSHSGIVVLARPVVLRPGGQDDPQLLRGFASGVRALRGPRPPRPGARRRRAFALERRRHRAAPVSRNVSRSRICSGAEGLSQPLGHDRERRRRHAASTSRRGRRSSACPSVSPTIRRVALGAERRPGGRGRRRARRVGDVIGVDGGARLRGCRGSTEA